jgi:ribosome maturation factor RimP
VGDFCLWSMEKVNLFAKIEEIVQSLDFLLIETNIRGDNHLKIIEVFIDGEKGINSEDCAAVSRALNDSIENENLIESSYRLDVSSPGVDRPLKYLSQFPKHVNRKFEIIYKDGSEEKKMIAKLIGIEKDQLFFEEKKSEYKIGFNDIVKAKVLISF